MATPIPRNQAEFAIDRAGEATGASFVRRESSHSHVRGITTDSRAATEGTLFVALRGESHDGHAFVEKAITQGAHGVVVERGRGSAWTNIAQERGATIFEVDDTLVAWGDLAAAHLARWRAGASNLALGSAKRTVLAITGTAGKTTTKEIAAALFSSHAKTLATIGNLNNRVGVPATIFMLDESHVHAVIETGMSLRGEIAELGRITNPDAAIITNVGVGHAGGVGGTRADVGREKGDLFAAIHEGGIAIANADDDEVMRQVNRPRVSKNVVTFGYAGNYRLLSREVNARGQRIEFSSPNSNPSSSTRAVTLPLPSEAQAIDFLAALAAMESLTGESMQSTAIENALSDLKMTGRLAFVRLKDGTVLIDDSYNANPQSMRVALRALSEAAGKDRRKVAILGEMKELGPIGTMEHEALGNCLADEGVDLAIGCGGLVALTLERAKARGVSVHSASTTDDARNFALQEVRAGDVVLVKGSRSVGTEVIVNALMEARGRAEDSP